MQERKIEESEKIIHRLQEDNQYLQRQFEIQEEIIQFGQNQQAQIIQTNLPSTQGGNNL